MGTVRRAVVITCIHGFLGRAADWTFLRDAGFDLAAPDLFSGVGSRVLGVGEPAALAALRPPTPDSRPPNALLGYSMGGRLALHALLAGAAFDKAIIVSAGLGIEDERQRAARREADEVWARRFESEEWSSLIAAWNAQPVFAGSRETILRREEDLDRRALAAALREWSPAILPPVASRLHEITIPTLWIAGARDQKYVAEGKRAVGLMPNATLAVIDGAGHRMLWERPDEFIELVRGFV